MEDSTESPKNQKAYDKNNQNLTTARFQMKALLANAKNIGNELQSVSINLNIPYFINVKPKTAFPKNVQDIWLLWDGNSIIFLRCNDPLDIKTYEIEPLSPKASISFDSKNITLSDEENTFAFTLLSDSKILQRARKVGLHPMDSFALCFSASKNLYPPVSVLTWNYYSHIFNEDFLIDFAHLHHSFKINYSNINDSNLAILDKWRIATQPFYEKVIQKLLLDEFHSLTRINQIFSSESFVTNAFSIFFAKSDKDISKLNSLTGKPSEVCKAYIKLLKNGQIISPTSPTRMLLYYSYQTALDLFEKKESMALQATSLLIFKCGIFPHINTEISKKLEPLHYFSKPEVDLQLIEGFKKSLRKITTYPEFYKPINFVLPHLQAFGTLLDFMVHNKEDFKNILDPSTIPLLH